MPSPQPDFPPPKVRRGRVNSGPDCRRNFFLQKDRDWVVISAKDPFETGGIGSESNSLRFSAGSRATSGKSAGTENRSKVKRA